MTATVKEIIAKFNKLSTAEKRQVTEVILRQANGDLLQKHKVFSGDEKKHRPFGLCAGEFVVPDDFDSPLSEEILAEFETE
jgi:hypothetical protein